MTRPDRLVSRRPAFDRAVEDPRLDGLRNRAGWLMRDGERCGLVLLRQDFHARHAGGALWWRRWTAPTECVHEYVWPDEVMDEDAIITDDGGLADWIVRRSQGWVELRGERVPVRWLDEATSAWVFRQFGAGFRDGRR